MSQTLPLDHLNGPSRNQSNHIKSEVNNLIEISDSSSSDDDDYENPYEPPPLPKSQNHQLGVPFAHNEFIDLGDDDEQYNPDLLFPGATAVPQDNMMRNLPAVKDEDPDINWDQWLDPDNDEAINRALWEDLTLQAENMRSSNLNHSNAYHSSYHKPFQQTETNVSLPKMETKDECIDAVVAVFPEICRDYLTGLYETVSESSGALIAHLLDKAESGSSYPKAKEVQKVLKRKRVLTEEEEAIQKYESADRLVSPAQFIERALT